MYSYDLIVLGAGPAGVSAAVSAAAAGLTVALFDENAVAGEALERTLAASAIHSYFAHQVWSVGGDTTGDYRIDAIGPQGCMHCTARALVVACGAHERVVPFEGWTTPGVIGLATATALLKTQDGLAGRSILIAGCGPSLVSLAILTLECKGKVEAIADVASVGEWARVVPAMLFRPNLLRRCVKWWRSLRSARVPLLMRHTIVKVEPAGARLRATLAPCDAAARPIAGRCKTIVADCLAVGHGLTPSTEVPRLLNAAHRYSRQAGGWIAVVTADGRTSRPRLYVAGDSAGITDDNAAAKHGTLAGLACALELAADDQAGLARQLKRARERYRRAARVGRAMARLMALRAEHVESIAPQTMVCRCEGVTRADIDAAFEAGARDANQLKAWTRCGMGLCQGRACTDVASELLAQRASGGSRESVGDFTVRTPLRPVSVEALTGVFTYADIPIPVAAPP